MSAVLENIESIVAATHQRLEKTELGRFYELRARLVDGARRWGGGLFLEIKGGGSPLSGYAFNRGGRKELQFNIGFDTSGYFRYGVAFSLQPDRNNPEPLADLAPRIGAFNRLLPRFPGVQNLTMWSWQGDARSDNHAVRAIPDHLIASDTFIFIGERVDARNGVTDEMLDRATEVLLLLLPLYEAIESDVSVRQASTLHDESKRKGSGVPTFVARLAFNSEGWQRPASAKEVQEAGNTYRNENGFGHEDWLFRNEWLLDGWRYGFVQGVNSSRAKLLRRGVPFNLRLFTMTGPGNRRAVAEIREVECLTDEAARAAVEAYEDRGWLDQMRTEVQAANGRPQALDEAGYAPFILNMRYRIDKLTMLDSDSELPPEDPIHRLKRYGLCEVSGAMDAALPKWRGRAGSTSLPEQKERQRYVSGGWSTYSPEHARIQEALKARLVKEYPHANILFEKDFVDVVAQTDDELLLFEVKSDLSPLAVIRQAFGQLLEYGFHPCRNHELSPRLVIVGRGQLEGADREYFELVKSRFRLPIEYWCVPV